MEKKENALSTEPYKGVRDFYPEDMAIQSYIFGVWRKVAEKFNFQEYSASILELAELYRGKGNNEIVNEQMYTFIDKGDREVALRPEMTPTLARMVAGRRKSLKFPLRWYSIPNCFRYERPQRGRKREHWQLNCDLLGISGIEAEVEIISLAHAIMKEFGARNEDFQIKIGSRAPIQKKLESTGVAKENYSKIFSVIDKKSKITAEEYESEMGKLGIEGDNLKNLLENANNESELISLLAKRGITNVEPVADVVRGFDYYTGVVFEVFDTNPENRRALFGGGRYDNLLEMFGVDPVPTVGFGMGDVTMRDFLETHDLPVSKQ